MEQTMDSPYPHSHKSSVAVRPDVTPNWDGAASPALAPVPSQKNTSQKTTAQGGRRRVLQKAKRSFIEEEDSSSSDDAQNHVGDHKIATTHPRRKISYRPLDAIKVLKNSNAIPFEPVPEPDTNPGKESRVDCNDGYSRPGSVRSPELSELGDRSDGRATFRTPFNVGDSRPASVAAPEPELDGRSDDHDEPVGQGESNSDPSRISPDPDEQSGRRKYTMRRSSGVNADEMNQSLNFLGKRLPVSSKEMKPPARKLKVDEPDDDGQRLNAFSLSALPPSTGNSPVANKTQRKTVTKKRNTKSSKQPRKQAVKQAAQQQKKPTTNQSKMRRPEPIKQELELSTGGEPDQEDSMVGSDMQEEQGSVRTSIPCQAKFKSLNSPVNTHLAATQDIISINSSMSDEVEEDDDDDDDFVPTSNLNPAKVESTQPKTRAATQYRAVKKVGTGQNACKPKTKNPQLRAKEKKPSNDESVTKLRPKAPSKMGSTSMAVEKTRIVETNVEPKAQLEESAPAISMSSQAKKANTVRHQESLQAPGSDGQSEGNTVSPDLVPTKPRQKMTRGLDKPDNVLQADEAEKDFLHTAIVVAFGRDGPKKTGKLKKIAKAPVSLDQHAPPSAEDGVSVGTDTGSATAANEQWKQRATETDFTTSSTSLSAVTVPIINTQRHSAQYQDAGSVHGFVRLTEADEDRAPKAAGEDHRRAGKELMNATFDDTMSDGLDVAASNGVMLDYTDDGYVTSALEPPPQPVTRLVLQETSNSQKVSAHEPKTVAVPPAKASFFGSMPAQRVSHYHPAARQNHLKRPFPEDKGVHGTEISSNQVSDSERPSQSAFPSSTQRPSSNTMLPPMDIGTVAKKSRFEAVHSASVSQDEEVVNGPTDSRIPANGSSDDVFYPGRQSEPAKRTAFVRNCISNDPRDHGATNLKAMPHGRGQKGRYSSPTNNRQRARALQPPDSVEQRMLAAISAPEANANMSIPSEYDPGVTSVQDGEQTPDLSDRTEPYGEGIGEIMHKSVNVILRNLKTKEQAITDVVENYEREGKRIVDRTSAVHDKERKQFIDQYEQHRLNYIKVCAESRLRTKATLNDLKSVDVAQILEGAGVDPAVARLRELQKVLQEPT